MAPYVLQWVSTIAQVRYSITEFIELSPQVVRVVPKPADISRGIYKPRFAIVPPCQSPPCMRSAACEWGLIDC